MSAGTTTETKPAREALLEAAALLFAERGPAAVSTREIATEAGVNNGLIHRHFGTKDELLRQTMERLAARIAEAADGDDAGSPLRFLDATREQSGYWRLLARCLLDGQSIDEIQTEFPTVGRIVALFEGLRDKGDLATDAEPRILAAALTATALGWMIYEPFLLRAAGLDDRELGDVRDDVRNSMMNLLLSTR